MAKTEKMICPRCSIPMNHHAEKPDPRFPEGIDPDSGGIVEAHACPRCGETAARHRNHFD